MPNLILDISMSLDGFIAGPNRSVDQPLGDGGLDGWAPVVANHRLAHSNTGATVMGRRMFSGGAGVWDDDPNADAWWGDDPPFHHPVFVLTHHSRDRMTKQSGTTFTFVTDGIESALRQARAVTTPDQDVAVGGGADVAQQYLEAGLLDELHLYLVPVILGDGIRLFNSFGPADVVLQRIRVVDLPGAVTYLSYRVVK
jgi:dihydrofolate reductase